MLTHDAQIGLKLSSFYRMVVLRFSGHKKNHLGKKINDIPSWLLAFFICAAALATSDKTLSAHFKGLIAHMYLMIQPAKDLGGTVGC